MSGEKTEKATPKKLKDLRKKGAAARSVELPAGVSLLVLVAVLPWMVGRMLDSLRTEMAVVLSAAGTADLDEDDDLLAAAVLSSGRALAPAVAIVGGAALQASTTATTLRRDREDVLVTDGPFAELKEQLGGFYIIEARDLDQALDAAKHCPLGSGTEVRPVWEVPGSN